MSVLNGNVAETTRRAQNGDPLAGLHLSLLETLVGGDTGAQNGGSLREGEVLGEVAHIVGAADGVLREAAVREEAGLVLLRAHGLPAAEAVGAVAAAVVKPSRTHAVPNLVWVKRVVRL